MPSTIRTRFQLCHTCVVALFLHKGILLHLSDYSFKFEQYDVGMNYAIWGQLALNT